jgi:thiol-disulfide isomerase/thioredoxin
MAAVLAIVAFTVAACAGAPAETPEPGDATDISGQLPTGPPPTEADASFTATTLDGEQIESSDLEPPLVLWFWAPWCTICQAEGPGIAEVAAEFEGQVRFYGVPGLGTAEQMQAFVADTGTEDLIHLVDADGSIWQRFGVVATPTHLFVSEDGAVELLNGWMQEVDLRERVQELVG